MIQSIQTLRAIAALSVVAVHIPPDIRARGYGEVFDFPQGAFGVDLFFVISGFVMAYSSRHLFAREHAPCEFILRRCARIVPTYWLVTTFVLYLSIKARTDLSWQHTAASYLFIPYPRPSDGAMLPLLLLGWTLNYEIFFYGVFAVGLRLRRGAAIAAIAVLFVLMTIAGLAYPLPEPLRFWTNSQDFWSSSTGCCSPRLISGASGCRE